MASTVTELVSSSSSADSTSYGVTVEVPDDYYSLLVAVVHNVRSGVVSIPSFSGRGATWTQRLSSSGGSVRTTMFTAPQTGYDGTVTADFGANVQEGCFMRVYSVTEIDPTSPFVQAMSHAIASASALLVPLSAVASADNPIIGSAVINDASANLTEGVGWTKLTESTIAAPDTEALSQWKLNDTTVDWSWTGSFDGSAVAIELNHATPSNLVNHFYDEENTLKSTATSLAWTGAPHAVIISGSSLSPNTKYLIIARALFGVSDLTDKGYWRVLTSDDATISSKSETVMEMQRTGSTELKSWMFVHSYTTDATPGNVELEYHTTDGATTYVDQASLLLIDLDDLGSDNYVEDIDTASGAELGLVGAKTVQSLISGSSLDNNEDYLVLGCTKIGVGSTGVNYNVTLGAAQESTSISVINTVDEEGEDTSEERMVGLVGRHNQTSIAPAIQVLAWEDAANGNMTNEGSYLIALKASAFADFEHDYIVSDSSGNGDTLLASVGPYTPSSNGNHLVIGRMGRQNGNADFGAYLEDGTTETRTGDSTPYHNQVWDSSKDYESAFTMQRISVSAQKTYNLYAKTSFTYPYEDIWLLVLNLNKYQPPTTYPPFPRRNLTTVRM